MEKVALQVQQQRREVVEHVLGLLVVAQRDAVEQIRDVSEGKLAVVARNGAAGFGQGNVEDVALLERVGACGARRAASGVACRLRGRGLRVADGLAAQGRQEPHRGQTLELRLLETQGALELARHRDL